MALPIVIANTNRANASIQGLQAANIPMSVVFHRFHFSIFVLQSQSASVMLLFLKRDCCDVCFMWCSERVPLI
jgi:hypothetical protein